MAVVYTVNKMCKISPMRIRPIALIAGMLLMLASAQIISCNSAPSATPMPTLTKAEALLKMAQAGANLKDADLSGADLSERILQAADLSGADLSGADLTGAYLFRADLSGADLSGADLSSANLIWANLSGADLSGADLSGADLLGANLDNVIGADFTGALNVPAKYLGDCGKC